MSVARQLADFVVKTGFDDLPPLVIEHSKMLIASTLASAAMGSNLPSSRIVRDAVLRRGGIAQSSVWFHDGSRLPAPSAARINALMSDAAASDDSDLRNITHPGTGTVAAALAVGEAYGRSAPEILRAIALGYEVAGNVNTGVIPGILWENGFHGCVVAIFGAATATGVLLRQDGEQLANTIGLASTSVAGLLAAANTSMAREHHAGMAAMMGVEVGEIASAGYTVEPTVLEHHRGFLAVYGEHGDVRRKAAEVTENLGRRWHILENMGIKLLPGAHPYHAIAEAAAEASRQGNLRVEEIERIVCSRVEPHEQVCGPRHPTDLIGMAHSPYYFAAAGAADKTFTWDHASNEKINDPRIRSLLDLVEFGPAPTTDHEKFRQGAVVSITTHDGRVYEATVFAPRGAAMVGIDWRDVEKKVKLLMPFGGLSDARVEAAYGYIRAFEDADISDTTALLTRHI